MPVFTSSLYLGFLHPHHRLPQWPALTTGMPAVLEEPATAAQVGRTVAAMIGVERALVAPSTLHAGLDVIHELCRVPDTAFLVDEGAYKIVSWTLEHALAQGIPVIRFPHHDVTALGQRLRQRDLYGRRPVLVTDGLCPGCGPTPIADLLAVAARHDGLLLLDDTQAFGVLGHNPTLADPYGTGGGGTLRWVGSDPSQVVVLASLAKGFGAPLAVTGGPASLIDRIAVNGSTRVHSSPPTAADLAAAAQALRLNRTIGDRRRRALAQLVARLGAGLDHLGLAARNDLFPVQPAGPFSLTVGRQVQDDLARAGVRTALQRSRCREGALVTFVVTAAHRNADVDWALDALEALTAGRAAAAPRTAGGSR